jgi:hypothetical protein
MYTSVHVLYYVYCERRDGNAFNSTELQLLF